MCGGVRTELVKGGRVKQYNFPKFWVYEKGIWLFSVGGYQLHGLLVLGARDERGQETRVLQQAAIQGFLNRKKW